MGYGDGANWDGDVPAASEVEYTIEWLTVFEGTTRQAMKCSFSVHTYDTAQRVAEVMAEAWNDTNPHGRRAIYERDHPNRVCKVRFDGYVAGMLVRAWRTDAGPPPRADQGWEPVRYGEKTRVLPPEGTPKRPDHECHGEYGLFVFRA